MTLELSNDKCSVAPYLSVPNEGAPALIGTLCGVCDEVLLGVRVACGNCGNRKNLKAVKLSEKGKLYAFSVVYRSFPGVKTPFVSAIVDLEGGGTLKGTLRNVEPDPHSLKQGMPVDVVFEEIDQKDNKGRPCTGYFFEPADQDQRG